MPFFSDAGPGGFQPKRQFRFLVTFSELGNLTFMVSKAAKPAYKVATKEHQVLNHQFKFPGIVKWDPITVDFIDAVDPNVGSKFYAALLNAGYVAPTAETALTTGITKVGTTSTIGEVRIKQLDGGGIILPAGGDPGEVVGAIDSTNIVEEWTLKNAWLSEVSWGDLNYAEDGLVTISTKIEFDYAVYNPERKALAT
jgi:hypothetical protein|tara:strand:- start:111 stop:701 length:591 start_codon:yes stop_codon:yes gene_type:complete